MFSVGFGIVAIGLWTWCHVRAFRQAAEIFGAALFLDFFALCLLAAALGNRVFWHALVREDATVEWATVFALVVAAGLHAASARAAFLRGERAAAAFAGLVALFCVFVAGEEVSWGQRLMGFRPPEIFLEENVQQEFNLHNFFNHLPLSPDVRFESGHVMFVVALAFGLVAPLVVSRIHTGVVERFHIAIPSLASGSLLVVSAWFYVWSPLHLSAEVAECLFAFGLLVAGFDVYGQAKGEPAALSKASLILRGAAAVVLPVMLAIGVDAAIAAKSPGDDERVAIARAEAQQIANDLVANEDGLGKRTLHKRLFTAVRSAYIAPTNDWTFLEGKRSPAERSSGARSTLPVRKDRRGYFIDPWNNAYWVHLMPRLGKLTVYSFGPNGRRDFDRKRPRLNEGDDIVVRVRLPSKAPQEIELNELFPGLDLPTPPKAAGPDEAAPKRVPNKANAEQTK